MIVSTKTEEVRFSWVSTYSRKNPLLGKVIDSFELHKEGSFVRFNCAGGCVVEAHVEGDCCSEAWIETVDVPALGFPAKVLSIKDLELGEISADELAEDVKFPVELQEWVSYYGVKISTDRGDMLIDFRNTSNGYYGGSVCWHEASRGT